MERVGPGLGVRGMTGPLTSAWWGEATLAAHENKGATVSASFKRMLNR